MDFTELWKELLDVFEKLKAEAEKHRFALVKSSLVPLSLTFRCSRVATDETIFFFEISRKENGDWDFRMKDKNGNYM